MFVYQNKKLYSKLDDGLLVGVDFDPSGNMSLVDGSETEVDLSVPYLLLTRKEVNIKFHLKDGNGYTFPIERKTEPKVEVEPEMEIEVVVPEEEVKEVKKEVKKNVATKSTKKSTGNSKRK